MHFVALLTKEKRLCMNGKMMMLINFQLYAVDIKDWVNSFSILVNLFKKKIHKIF